MTIKLFLGPVNHQTDPSCIEFGQMIKYYNCIRRQKRKVIYKYYKIFNINNLIFYYQASMDNQKQKSQLPKVRKEKKKNTQTGLLMGQNMNVFSQLSATYLQAKSSATEQQTNFVNSTQIIQYHDPNINRLIALLRKKADITKAKAAVELKQQIMKMNEQNIEQFIQTFTHLFMEIVINEQSKQVIEQFIIMMNHVLTSYKKIVIKQIATIFGPFLVINRANNLSQNKIYSLLFNGTDEQIQQKAIILLLNKNVMKKFLVFCRVIIQCQQSHKIGQQNFQRNCSSLLKVIKELIRNYSGIKQKKQEMITSFCRFMQEINEIVSNKLVQEYFKVGGKAKSSFLQFYQVLISSAHKNPQWNIDWQNYAKIICQNYLDKDVVVQQSLWKYCNRQFIQSSLELEKLEQKTKEQGKQKQRYGILHKFLPKPDQKLLSALKIGGQTLYKQLPAYCTVFPYTSFQQTQSHKSSINKISFIRKLMVTVLDLEDENQTRIECYYQLASYFIKELRNCNNFIAELDEKKQQQIRSLALKAQKQIVNNLQDRFYKNPPISRNSSSYYIPILFCKLLQQGQPNFDFIFDKKQSFPLFSPLKNGKNTEYCQNLHNRIFQNCKNDQNLLLSYAQNFPRRSINVDMSDKNEKIEQACKIFLLSTQSKNEQNWFKQNWDVRKILITFDPRISATDLASTTDHDTLNKYGFKPSNRLLSNEQNYISIEHDSFRFKYFIVSLESTQQQKLSMVIYMVPLIREIVMARDNESRNMCINQLLDIHSISVDKLGKRQWIVSESQVLRLRVISELVLEGLRHSFNEKKDQPIKTEINKQNQYKFLNNYCNFVLTIYNYKLEKQAEQLLKLLSKNLFVPEISQTIFKSARQSIGRSYETFTKTQGKQIKEMKEGQEKQRKNRLNRVLNFVKKILWYAINKKKQQCYLTLIEDTLANADWRFSEYRPDLWLLCECILETVDQRTKQAIVKKLLSQYKKYSHFLTILLCCQMVLALQRHPSTKKTIAELQSQALKQIRQKNTQEQNIQLMICSINEAISNESFLLINGSKNLLKNIMKNYQKLSESSLKRYVSECISKPLKNLNQQKQQGTFNRKCLLLISSLSQLPLLDLPNIQTIYSQLSNLSLSEGYLSVIGTLWQSAIGVDKITPQIQNKMIEKLFQSLKDRIKQEVGEHNNNFVRFYGLIFLNSFIQVKGRQSLNQYWDFVLKQLVWAPVKQGTLLHGGVQSARYKLISKIFSSSSKNLQIQLFKIVPEQILKQIRFYKQILDQIQDEDKLEQQPESTSTHYQNIINMFIECAEVIVRMTASLSKQLYPKQQIVLELLQCPFAGIKKTSFMLLKQMYQLNLVDRLPPAIFLTYLKLNVDIAKAELDPILANAISGYLYSWQAIIERRSALERPPSTEQQTALSLEDYLQSEQLHEPLLRSIFDICQNQLEYTKNQQQYEVSPEQLVEMNSIVTIQDDLNLHSKMFRLAIRTLFMFIQNFPLFLRDFIDKNKKYKIICEKLLRNVITDAIFKQEINKIQVRQHEWKANGNFEIYVVPKNKQIYAQYTHDVIRIGLRLVMRSNYPLIPISIQFGEGLKIEEGSRWALMLQTQLHSRNNTIINGILLWKDNIDKKLAGVQECSICFDIVNSQGQLPKKGCKTCKKKFHSVCIMKWFSKSNKSQCPLCKSQFL